MKELVERTIAEQEEMLSANIGEQEKYAVRYCIFILKDLLDKSERMYEGIDGKFYPKTW